MHKSGFSQWGYFSFLRHSRQQAEIPVHLSYS
nr:MAG TPA: hypothetical protein [Bacteriophage sp.]